MSASPRGKRRSLHTPSIEGLPLLVAGPGLALVANDGMQLDLDGVLRVVAAVALAPVVADGICEDVAGTREGCGRDAAADFGVTLETVLGVLVPEVEGAVATGGAEGAVDRVEGDCVDRVYFGDIALGGVGLAVALEGEVQAFEGLEQCSGQLREGEGLPGVFILDVLNCAAAFDRSYCEARRVAEARHYACLPLQGAVDGLVDLGRVL
jgi:hypothetical protein